MSFLIKRPSDIKPSEITPRHLFENRRKFMKHALSTSLLMGASGFLPDVLAKQWPALKKSSYSTDEEPNSLKDITTYNNFYEFGTGKGDPVKNAHEFNPKPWSITVEGEAEKTGTFDLEDFIKPYALEERIYRFRCVEAWSMVVPWVGFPLAEMLKTFKPTSKAKFVEFETLYDVSRMPKQSRKVLDWPYREGLRIDEAMNPLTLMTVGLYGDVLPNQNGAPIRLIVPWKYGFKSIKSIVKIKFRETQPVSTWEQLAPNEYGFYSNVNPNVDHPRWSQKSERRLGDPFWAPKIKTRMFNGYEKEVADLYKGMDLAKFY